MSEVKFMYLRDENGIPRVTIAFRLDGIDRVRFGYAVQNVQEDRWDRALGRTKALGRLNSHTEHLFAKVDPTLAHANNAQMAAICDLIRNSDVPTRMRRGAQLWLENMWEKTKEEKEPFVRRADGTAVFPDGKVLLSPDGLVDF